jgi:hypothetical protein
MKTKFLYEDSDIYTIKTEIGNKEICPQREEISYKVETVTQILLLGELYKGKIYVFQKQIFLNAKRHHTWYWNDEGKTKTIRDFVVTKLGIKGDKIEEKIREIQELLENQM